MTAADLAALMAPKGLDYYRRLTPGGELTVSLTQDEAAVALKLHDHGFEALRKEELRLAYNLVFKLKTEIFP